MTLEVQKQKFESKGKTGIQHFGSANEKTDNPILQPGNEVLIRKNKT